MNSRFAHTTSSERKRSFLLTIVQGRRFANGVSRNAL
jgi:hypothetical protein